MALFHHSQLENMKWLKYHVFTYFHPLAPNIRLNLSRNIFYTEINSEFQWKVKLIYRFLTIDSRMKNLRNPPVWNHIYMFLNLTSIIQVFRINIHELWPIYSVRISRRWRLCHHKLICDPTPECVIRRVVFCDGFALGFALSQDKRTQNQDGNYQNWQHNCQ